jgi:hypothetical protein
MPSVESIFEMPSVESMYQRAEVSLPDGNGFVCSLCAVFLTLSWLAIFVCQPHLANFRVALDISSELYDFAKACKKNPDVPLRGARRSMPDPFSSVGVIWKVMPHVEAVVKAIGYGGLSQVTDLPHYVFKREGDVPSCAERERTVALFGEKDADNKVLTTRELFDTNKSCRVSGRLFPRLM